MSPALVLMLEQPPAWGEKETAAERRARLTTIETAAEMESMDPPKGWPFGSLALKATLLVTSNEEGQHWRKAVHSGKITGDDGRARCLNQLHRHHVWVPGPMWRATTGTDLESTRLCMRGAVNILSHYSATCVSAWQAEHDFEGAMARVVVGYGTGKHCSPVGRPWATRRARRIVRWLKEMEAN